MSVAINPPKTPVTKGSNGIAAATVPNVCKMPGPPAPFVPTPLPNIGRSSLSPKGYSKKVKIQGKPVAIKGATFASQGDIASKGTGGGIVSSNTHGPTKFVGPGALDVKIEGKNVQLLSDPMLNNCGPSGNPPNSATLQGVIQGPDLVALWGDEKCPICDKAHKDRVENQEDAQLKESGATKSACSSVQSAVAEMKLETEAEKRAYGMLGAVECKTCSDIYFAQSNKQQKALRAKLKDYHHYDEGKGMPKARSDARKLRFATERLATGIGSVYDKMTRAYDDWKKKGKPGESRNLPGTCAAQQAMLLTIDHGCRPKAMTERLAKGKCSPGVVQNIAVRRVLEDGSLSEAELESFGGEKAVPPCATCQAMLTAMMCNQLEKECEDTPASAKVTCGKC